MGTTKADLQAAVDKLIADNDAQLKAAQAASEASKKAADAATDAAVFDMAFSAAKGKVLADLEALKVAAANFVDGDDNT